MSPDTEKIITRHNYFRETLPDEKEEARDRFAGVEQLLKKAARMIDSSAEGSTQHGLDGTESQTLRESKHAAMLSQRDRDLDDMDMGFGESRFDDGDDEEGDARIRLSEWKGSAGRDQNSIQAVSPMPIALRCIVPLGLLFADQSFVLATHGQLCTHGSFLRGIADSLPHLTTMCIILFSMFLWLAGAC